MNMILEQFVTEDMLRLLRERAGREGRSVQGVVVEAMEWWLKNGERQKDLSDREGSWIDSPRFENQVLKSEDV